MKTSAIDLFCGIGGLSYGLKKAGISVVAGIDLDDTCQYAYEENVKADFLHRDITKVTGDELEAYFEKDNADIRVLAGCAPCQPFSTHANKNKNKEKSDDWNLINQFKRLVVETQPAIVTMENVPNLANKQIFKDFVSFLKDNKYFVSYTNVYAPDYGIPQKRRRLVLLASMYGEINIIPPTHSPENYVTLQDAIGDLPSVKAGEVSSVDPLHRSIKLKEINLKRIRASKPNGTWEDWEDDLKLACHKKKTGRTYKAVYGRMSWEEPASTITTQFHNYGTGRFGHPEQDRALTLREGALLQTFPPDYKFFEDESKVFIRKFGVHIGNAVPVDLGTVIGESIKAHIGEYHDTEE
jgi:DNA (cytosine-5)-methyltransferase 1